MMKKLYFILVIVCVLFSVKTVFSQGDTDSFITKWTVSGNQTGRTINFLGLADIPDLSRVTNPTQDREHPTQDRKHPTQDREHPAQDREHPTQDREHPTQDRKHPTQDREHPTQDSKHPTQDSKHPTEDRKHYTKNIS